MPHATATFNSRTLASTDDAQYVEGNYYFPPSSITDKSVFTPNSTTTVCPWKGTASYYDINIDGKTAQGAAWYYPSPTTERAAGLKDYVAFCEFDGFFSLILLYSFSFLGFLE